MVLAIRLVCGFPECNMGGEEDGSPHMTSAQQTTHELTLMAMYSHVEINMMLLTGGRSEGVRL